MKSLPNFFLIIILIYIGYVLNSCNKDAQLGTTTTTYPGSNQTFRAGGTRSYNHYISTRYLRRYIKDSTLRDSFYFVRTGFDDTPLTFKYFNNTMINFNGGSFIYSRTYPSDSINEYSLLRDTSPTTQIIIFNYINYSLHFEKNQSINDTTYSSENYTN